MDLNEITPEWILERFKPHQVIKMYLSEEVDGVTVSRDVMLTATEILGVLRARKSGDELEQALVDVTCAIKPPDGMYAPDLLKAWLRGVFECQAAILAFLQGKQEG